jgi:hypothetical protein
MTEHPLDRTLLLMRDELTDSVTDDQLRAALQAVRVQVRIDRATAATHAGQSGLLTLAWLLARSGHQIWVDAPDLALIRSQPPATATSLVAALLEVGDDLGVGIIVTGRCDRPELELRLGNLSGSETVANSLALGWSRWSATIRLNQFPIASGDAAGGALAAAALGAGEAFKLAMQKLRMWARNPDHFCRVMAPAPTCRVRLAPEQMDANFDLGEVDVVSGGAITNAALYTLFRTAAAGRFRVADDDTSGCTNLNRNALLRKSRLGLRKVVDIAQLAPAGFGVTPIIGRYGADPDVLKVLRSTVLVGVDDIAARWAVQREAPGWVGVGATSHFMTVVSSHPAGAPCAGCLHPRDTPIDGPIPTVAFVSFWAGLLLAIRVMRHRTGMEADGREQQTVLYPLRPDNIWESAIAPHPNCPVKCGSSRAALRVRAA